VAVLLDTHAVVWYLLDSKELSSEARRTIDSTAQAGESIYLASISLVEIIYLVEKGRLPEIALERLNGVLMEPAGSLLIVPLDAAIAQTVRQIPRGAIPDMPDRIMAATALHLRLPLVTRDQQIRSAGVNTVW
jgi:PIN domain nuclease of toxin-antitoxin system